jgi:PPM family protein phosphatase
MHDIRYPVKIINDVPVITTPDQIDVATADQLRLTLVDAAAYGHTTVVVDMTGTRFCDSAGLRVLVRAHKRALAEGSELRLVIPAGGAVFRIFSLTTLYRFIPRFDSLHEALLQRPAAVIVPFKPRDGRRAVTHHPGAQGGADLRRRRQDSPYSRRPRALGRAIPPSRLGQVSPAEVPQTMRSSGILRRKARWGGRAVIGFRHGAATSTGRVRLVNEDSYLTAPPIYAVADGMGGHGSGDLASALAVQVLARCADLHPLFLEAVLAALEEANQVIIERESASLMGTTVTGLVGLGTAGADHLMVFNVGDSRVYRLAGDGIEQLTVDHSEVQELLLDGVITREQARSHPRRNIVTRALGTDPVLLADRWLLPAVGGDRFLLCSDGLFGELSDEAILPLLSAGTPQQAAEALVMAANDVGGRDNITAVIVDIESDDDGADEKTMPREALGAGVLGGAHDGDS